MKAMHVTNDADELQRAELAVEESRAELNRSLRRVSQTGEQLLKQVRAEIKPGMAIAAAAVGAVVVTGAAIALVRRSRRSHWFAAQPPSTLGVVAKSVGLWALRLAARNVAAAVVARLEQQQPEAAAPGAQTARVAQ